MSRFLPLSLLPLLALACSTSASDADSSNSAVESPIATKLTELGAAPCEANAEFQCVKISSKLDHFGMNRDKVDVIYAVHAAPAETRKGVLIVAMGGAGSSGIASASTFRDADPRIAENYDIVYFDVRGVGKSGAIECKVAAKKFYEGGLRADSDATEQALTAKAKAFSEECRSEANNYDLELYSTVQAAEDLEDFRVAFKEDKVSLYGANYGSELVQRYATRHAANVKAVIIDGAVDATLGQTDRQKAQSRGVAKVLTTTIAECAKVEACVAPFANAAGATPEARVLTAYDAIGAALDSGPKAVVFPLAAGGTAIRKYSRADLDTTTLQSMGDPDSRRDFLRALTKAYVEHDYLALLQQSYAVGKVDPETAPELGTVTLDAKASDAMTFTFSCNDYGRSAATERERVAIYLSAGRELWTESKRVLSPYYSALPCASWSTGVPFARPAPFKAEGIPVIVVGATGDAVTPVDQAEAVASRLADGYLVTVDGGRHVTFGRDNACANKLVADFIVEGKKPDQKATRCAGTFVSP